MKKVILFIDNLGSGGAQRQVVNVAVLLKNAGYDVSVLVYQNIPFYKHILDENGIQTALVESKGNLSRIISIRKYINKSGCDAVIAFLETPCFIACLSKIGKRWRLITTERSAKMSTFTSRRSKLFNKFERFSDAKIGNSHNAINMWKKYYPQYNEKYGVIYNYVSVPEEYINLEHEYLCDGKLHIAVAASYQELKNPIGVVEALHMMSNEQRARLDVQWYGRKEVTIGDTSTFDKAQSLIKEYGLENCITLNDETNEVYSIMANSDAVGLFSKVEGLPNTICEAMTIGRPVIMSRVSDYDVLVSDNGVLCNPESFEDIRDAILEMLSKSNQELQTMGEASKEKAKNLFSAKAITEQWAQVIERC